MLKSYARLIRENKLQEGHRDKKNSLKSLLVPCFCLLIQLFCPLLRAAEVPVVAAAASVKFALHEIAEAFHKETGKTVRISYASSGNLSRQIQQGAPFEIFMSANAEYVEKLYQQHKAADRGIIYAVGRLALLTNQDSALPLDKQLNGIKQALQDGRLQRFAIANPKHAPYGVAAREVLQHLGLWETVKPHLVLGENIAQAAQFASSGAAQAGLVSYSLALAPTLQNSTRLLLIPAKLHHSLEQTMVLLNNAGATAKLFFNYLQQNKARSIFSCYGYSEP